jgi:hypothetical protein
MFRITAGQAPRASGIRCATLSRLDEACGCTTSNRLPAPGVRSFTNMGARAHAIFTAESGRRLCVIRKSDDHDQEIRQQAPLQ